VREARPNAAPTWQCHTHPHDSPHPHGRDAAGGALRFLTWARIPTCRSFPGMSVKLVWCDQTYCRGHASNLMTARSMFRHNEPFLIVMSDHLFEPRLLAKFAEEAALYSCTDAVALVDDTEEIVSWSKEDHWYAAASIRGWLRCSPAIVLTQ
jgi:hypothetical protein